MRLEIAKPHSPSFRRLQRLPKSLHDLSRHAEITLIPTFVAASPVLPTWRSHTEVMAPGEGFEPSRPQRTTGFLCSIPGLGSSTWDLPRTRLGNPGVSQPRLSTADQLPLNRHKDSHRKMIRCSRCLVAPHSGVCSSRHQNSHDLGCDSLLLLDHGFT
jgi:hypothetical protein